MRRLASVLAMITACLTTLPGCGAGNSNVWVTGQLLKGGAKYTPPEGQKVTVTFLAMEVTDSAGKTIKDFNPYQASLDPESGTFKVPGVDGSGIPPGKYRVTVIQKMTREAFEATKTRNLPGKGEITRETDYLDGKFGPMKSPFVFDIKGSMDLVVDLDKPPAS